MDITDIRITQFQMIFQIFDSKTSQTLKVGDLFLYDYVNISVTILTETA